MSYTGYSEGTFSAQINDFRNKVAEQERHILRLNAVLIAQDKEIKDLKILLATSVDTTVKTPVVKTPVVETPAVKAPVVETPVVETPVVETPVVETPVVETPVVETPVTETSTVEASKSKKK